MANFVLPKYMEFDCIIICFLRNIFSLNKLLI
jgi:hypothetical protein